MLSRAAFLDVCPEPTMPRISAKLLSCVLFALIGCKKEQGSGMVGKDAKGPIVVGEVGSMTGTEATFGTSSDRGIQLAVTETNSAGGIKGRQVQIIALDDEGKPEEAATAATRLIASEHVTALLGEVASTRSASPGCSPRTSSSWAARSRRTRASPRATSISRRS